MIKKISIPTVVAVFAALWAINNVTALAPAKTALKIQVFVMTVFKKVNVATLVATLVVIAVGSKFSREFKSTLAGRF